MPAFCALVAALDALERAMAPGPWTDDDREDHGYALVKCSLCGRTEYSDTGRASCCAQEGEL